MNRSNQNESDKPIVDNNNSDHQNTCAYGYLHDHHQQVLGGGGPSNKNRDHRIVQRSKSDVRHENRHSVLQARIRDEGSFGLANLLERGRSLDARLFGAISDNEDESARPAIDGLYGGVGRINGLGSRVQLPARIRQAAMRLRGSGRPVYPPSASLSGSLSPGSSMSVCGPLDSLPEVDQHSNDVVSVVVPSSAASADRERDIEAAIPWLQQEIRLLKLHDRKLFRQLLDLGTEIHKLTGMESCQSFSTSLDMDDIDTIRRNYENCKEHELHKNSVPAIHFSSAAAAAAPPSDDNGRGPGLGPAGNGEEGSKAASESKPKVSTLKANKLLELYSSFDSFFR